MSERTYSEREIADLIARAAERQQDARQRDDGPGLTLSEIERIGRESGIDPAHLRAAAAEMDSAGRTLSRQSGHTRTHVTAERWIDAPLAPEAWEEAVTELQDRLGVNATYWMGQSSGGTVQQVGNAYEWQHTSSIGVQTTVTASPRGDRTRLRIRQLVGLASPTAEGIGYGAFIAVVAGAIGGALSGAALGAVLAFLAVWLVAAPTITALDRSCEIGTAFIAVVAGAIGGALSGAALGAVLAFLAVWLVAAPTITALDRRWRARKLSDLEALADDVGSLLATPQAMPGSPASAVEGSSPNERLDPSLLDAPDGAEPAPRRRQRVR